MATVHLLVAGKVQGVFYRVSAKKQADALQLTGWVRNAPDGRVECLACGNLKELERFIAWCRQGPSRAQVSDVEIRWEDQQEFADFRILH
jgi:acylphosphatase